MRLSEKEKGDVKMVHINKFGEKESMTAQSSKAARMELAEYSTLFSLGFYVPISSSSSPHEPIS